MNGFYAFLYRAFDRQWKGAVGEEEEYKISSLSFVNIVQMSRVLLTEKTDMASYNGKREKGFADLIRSQSPELAVEERLKGFGEVEGCLNDEQAKQEANRCLQCDFEFKMIQQKRESKQEG